jgi:hypothetical protein
MADEHRFSAEVAGPSIPTEGRSRWQSCLIGCLVVFVILLVIAILFAFWVSRNWRNWAATAATEGIRQGISSSQLPAQEQQEIMVQVDRVAIAFREKTVSGEQLGKLAEKLIQSPLMSLMVTSTIDQHYFAKSGLSEEEKTEGRRTLQRFIRGSIDEKINEAGIDAAMAHVADRDAQGNWKLRETLSDDDLRAFLAEAKKQADAAGIPDQPADIDPSEEIKKIVDEALAAPGAEPQAAPQAVPQ